MYYAKEYISEIKTFIKDNKLEIFSNKKLLLSGGTGLICSFFIDTLLATDFNFKITLLCSNTQSAKIRFSAYENDSRIEFLEVDLKKKIDCIADDYDYILSAASFTDPKNYSAFPVETIVINVIGSQNLFEVAKSQKHLKKFLVFSSCEVYGEEKEVLTEETKGIVNCLNVRSCYNESKRLVETMAVAYSKEYGIDAVIARFSRVYGPTMKLADSKALSQFMLNSITGKDVVLKSQGTQRFSYCYVSDAVSALITLLEKGETANAYNITNDTEQVELREIARMVASIEGVNVHFEIPSATEQAGYSIATVAIQDASKLKKLGWIPAINLEEGIKRTLPIIKQRIQQKDV